MTRIFDALKKADSGRAMHPAAPPPPPVPAPFTPAMRPPGAPIRPTQIIPGVFSVPSPESMSDGVLREMSQLKINIESVLTERTPRVVMLLSSQAGEGTSAVATQLAHYLARSGADRVLLVDVHAERPALTPERFGPISGTIVPGAAALLSVLPLASQLSRAALNPAGLRDIIERVSSGYDWIVLDGPPVLEAPDATALAAATDGVVLVVQAGRTKRPVLTRSADLLRKSGARVLGTVLNRRRLEIPGFIYRRL